MTSKVSLAFAPMRCEFFPALMMGRSFRAVDHTCFVRALSSDHVVLFRLDQYIDNRMSESVARIPVLSSFNSLIGINQSNWTHFVNTLRNEVENLGNPAPG